MKNMILIILACCLIAACKKEKGITILHSAPYLFEVDDANDTLYSLFIPNSFSPNGDGINDVYQVKGRCIFKSLRIYSKYSNLLFETTDMKTGWDGRISSDATIAPIGGYTYVLSFSDKREKKYELRGSFYLSN